MTNNNTQTKGDTMNAQIDAVANSTKAELSKYQRDMEKRGFVALCATCDREAAPGSCYCESCEDEIE